MLLGLFIYLQEQSIFLIPIALFMHFLVICKHAKHQREFHQIIIHCKNSTTYICLVSFCIQKYSAIMIFKSIKIYEYSKYRTMCIYNCINLSCHSLNFKGIFTFCTSFRQNNSVMSLTHTAPSNQIPSFELFFSFKRTNSSFPLIKHTTCIPGYQCCIYGIQIYIIFLCNITYI